MHMKVKLLEGYGYIGTKDLNRGWIVDNFRLDICPAVLKWFSIVEVGEWWNSAVELSSKNPFFWYNMSFARESFVRAVGRLKLKKLQKQVRV